MTISVPNWVADLGEMVTFMLIRMDLALYITGYPPLEYRGTSQQRHRRLETSGPFSVPHHFFCVGGLRAAVMELAHLGA